MKISVILTETVGWRPRCNEIYSVNYNTMLAKNNFYVINLTCVLCRDFEIMWKCRCKLAPVHATKAYGKVDA
jgi:hypothetical protein